MGTPRFKVEVNADDPNQGIVHTATGAVDVERDPKTGLWSATKTAAEDHKLDQQIAAQGPEDRGRGVDPGSGDGPTIIPGKPVIETAKPDATDSWSPDWSAMARGFAQGATANTSDEMGGLGAKIYDLTHGTDAKRAAARGVNAPVSDRTSYDVETGAQRQENAAAQKRSPWSYGLGDVGGATALMVAPGAGLARVSPAAAALMGGPPTLVGSMAQGAAYGSAAGAGGAQEGQRLEGAVQGAQAGALGGALGHGLGKLAGAVGNAATRAGQRQLAKRAVPQAQLIDREIDAGKEAVEQLGAEAEKIGLSGNSIKMAQQAKAAVAKAGQAVDQVATAAADVPVDLQNVRTAIQNKIVELGKTLTPKSEREIQALQEQLQKLDPGQGVVDLGSKVPFDSANATKKWFSDAGRTAAGNKKAGKAAFYRTIAKDIDDSMRQGLEAHNPDLLAEYDAANHSYSIAKDLAKGTRAQAKAVAAQEIHPTVLGLIQGGWQQVVNPALQRMGLQSKAGKTLTKMVAPLVRGSGPPLMVNYAPPLGGEDFVPLER